VRAPETSVVIGGALQFGILATGTRHQGGLHYDYAPGPDAVIERVRRIEAFAIATAYPCRQAALSFPLAHPQVASVIPGLDSPHLIDLTMKFHRAHIPMVSGRN